MDRVMKAVVLALPKEDGIDAMPIAVIEGDMQDKVHVLGDGVLLSVVEFDSTQPLIDAAMVAFWAKHAEGA